MSSFASARAQQIERLVSEAEALRRMQAIFTSHSRVAIVASSGNLKYRGLGPEIDAHDVVVRVNNAPLVGHWAVCAAPAVGAGLFAWIIGSFYYALFLPFRPLMVHLGLAVAIYPLFALLSGLLPRAAIAGERV